LANPTTNYGFVLPTSSDLVTDLPADFDVALQGVDTRLKALQPGTTLGDLAYSSATANTNTRLGIGSTGQVLTVAAGVPSWATPASTTPNAQGVSVFNSTDQSIASGSYTTATFNSEYFDTDAFHSTSTNTGRLTVPAGMAGEYAIVTNIYVSPTASGDLVAKLQINGSDKNRFVTKLNSGEAVSVAFTSLVTLAVSDYVEVLVYQNTGSNQNLSTNQYGLFGMYRIGA
jgi:hypothetical protein